MAPARKVPKLHKKTVALAEGTRFVDTQKQEFVIGKEIGQGGFGRIYEGKQVFESSGFLISKMSFLGGYKVGGCNQGRTARQWAVVHGNARLSAYSKGRPLGRMENGERFVLLKILPTSASTV